MEEVWAPDCRSSGSKRDTGLGCSVRRTFSLGLAGFRLRSLKRGRRRQPPSPAVLGKRPYAAVVDVARRTRTGEVAHQSARCFSSAFTASLLPGCVGVGRVCPVQIL